MVFIIDIVTVAGEELSWCARKPALASRLTVLVMKARQKSILADPIIDIDPDIVLILFGRHCIHVDQYVCCWELTLIIGTTTLPNQWPLFSIIDPSVVLLWYSMFDRLICWPRLHLLFIPEAWHSSWLRSTVTSTHGWRVDVGRGIIRWAVIHWYIPVDISVTGSVVISIVVPDRYNHYIVLKYCCVCILHWSYYCWYCVLVVDIVVVLLSVVPITSDLRYCDWWLTIKHPCCGNRKMLPLSPLHSLVDHILMVLAFIRSTLSKKTLWHCILIFVIIDGNMYGTLWPFDTLIFDENDWEWHLTSFHWPGIDDHSVFDIVVVDIYCDWPFRVIWWYYLLYSVLRFSVTFILHYICAKPTLKDTLYCYYSHYI